MFNVAVLNLKDIIKYFAGIIILFFVIFLGTKYIKNVKVKSDELSNQTENISTALSENSLLPCIEATLPVVSQLDSNNEAGELSEKKDIFKEILKTQIGSISETEKMNEEIVEEDKKVDEKEKNEIEKEEKAVSNQSRRGENESSN